MFLASSEKLKYEIFFSFFHWFKNGLKEGEKRKLSVY